ncbi:hypothetical protein KEM52_006226 [Ascosphaera acerosa]|nr:hypothetical protein KEM52_006226 [Ascosphaera acerosa]
MTRGSINVEKFFYRGDTDDFLVFVEDPQTVQQWKDDRSIPLSQVVRAMKVFTTHKHGAQGVFDEASRSTMHQEFGTDQVEAVICKILEDGYSQDMKVSLAKMPAAAPARPAAPDGAAASGQAVSVQTAAKRRRAGQTQAHATLTKPFKSPLKAPVSARAAAVYASGGGNATEGEQERAASRTPGEDETASPWHAPRKEEGVGLEPPAKASKRDEQDSPAALAAAATTPDRGRQHGLGLQSGSPGLVTHSIASTSPSFSPALARRVAGVHGAGTGGGGGGGGAGMGRDPQGRTSTFTSPSPLKRLLSPMKQPSRPATNPQLITLQRQHSALLRSLAATRATLDQLQQALRIEKQGQDEQLRRLIVRWRGVAQRAAEEVFEGAKERVEKMGGVKAWREMSNGGKGSVGWGWDVDAIESKVWVGGSDVDSEDDVREETGAAQGRSAGQGSAVVGRSELEDAFERELDAGGEVFDDLDEEVAAAAEEEAEEELTMEAMLQILNVDVKVIGYDREGERWV